jgi:hypothetical protein
MTAYYLPVKLTDNIAIEVLMDVLDIKRVF